MTLNIIATAHGTNSSQGQQTIDAIRQRLQERLNLRLGPVCNVYEAYVDVQNPPLEEVVEFLPKTDQTILLPLLLSTGYHTQVDIKQAAVQSGIEEIAIAGSLGPSLLLARLLKQRLEEAGWTPGNPVVLAGAGSSRVDGQNDVMKQASALMNELAQDVSFGFVADIEPTLEQAIHKAQTEGTVYVANYLMGEGHFNTKAQDTAQELGAVMAQPLAVVGDERAIEVLVECALDSIDRVELMSEV